MGGGILLGASIHAGALNLTVGNVLNSHDWTASGDGAFHPTSPRTLSASLSADF